jgi:hypothetical protein
LLLAGCASAPPQPQSQRDPSVNFAAFRTFTLPSPQGVNAQDQPLTLLDRNIRTAIADQMRRKGYSEVSEGADLRVLYETSSTTRVENNPVQVGIGMGSWGSNVGGSINVGSPSVRNYQEGTLVVHVVDAARNAEVWEGRVSTRVNKGSLEPAAVSAVVADVMRDLPARPPGQ